VSGAVGAICRHLSVDSNTSNRVCGGDDRYLNMSFSGWPELTNSFLFICGLDGFDEEASGSGSVEMLRYVGFVSQLNDWKRAASPNIARGKGCCGMMVPDGSVSPGRICIGIEVARSVRVADRDNIG